MPVPEVLYTSPTPVNSVDHSLYRYFGDRPLTPTIHYGNIVTEYGWPESRFESRRNTAFTLVTIHSERVLSCCRLNVVTAYDYPRTAGNIHRTIYETIL